jgi:hypothetical protein
MQKRLGLNVKCTSGRIDYGQLAYIRMQNTW